MRTRYTKCKIYQPNLNQLKYTLMFNKLHCKLNINKTTQKWPKKLVLVYFTLKIESNKWQFIPRVPAFPQSSVPSIARIQDKDLLFNFVKTSKYVHHSDTSFYNDAITNIVCIGRVAIVGSYFWRSDRISRFSCLYTIIHLSIYDNCQLLRLSKLPLHMFIPDKCAALWFC